MSRRMSITMPANPDADAATCTDIELFGGTLELDADKERDVLAAAGLADAACEVSTLNESVEVTTDEGRPRQQAAVLIDIGRCHFLFHDTSGDAYARLQDGGCYPIAGSEYRETLSGVYYRLTGKGANRNSVAEAVATLTAIARNDGPEEPVYLRVGKKDNAILIDSGRPDRSCYIITAKGWRIDTPPINFRRSGKQMALPLPGKSNFSLIWKHVNVAHHDRVQVAAWMLSALRPDGPYPILAVNGEQGTGKTKGVRTIKALTDPSASALRAPPRDERDMLIAALNSWVVAVDNLSGIDPQLSDALCRISTGGSLSARKLYTDTDEVLIEIQRPVILNGIDEIAGRPDMAQRCIHIEAPTLGKYIPESDLDASFAEDAGAIFAALLDGVALALRDVTLVTLDRPPRMADFARWAAAGLPALGFTAAEFLSAYHANQVEAVEAGLESSAIGQSVRAFMDNREEWTGTSSELLKILSQIAGDVQRSRAWPQSPKGLINALRRLGPSLRQIGIEWGQAHQRDRRTVSLCTMGPQVSQVAQVSQPSESVTDVTHVTHSTLLCTHGGEPWEGDL